MNWISGFLAACAISVAAARQFDVWDLPPLRYSDTPATDRMAELAERFETGGGPDAGDTPLDRLRFVLAWLDVPESSQTLVFSKTSKQIRKIGPSTPRALYFSEDHYVGYVPGGAIEVISQDPVLGPVFYLVEVAADGRLEIGRDRSDCFSCHGTTRTESVPGVFVRSVFPDADGQAILSLGSENVDHTTPIPERWGGYFVTGNSALPHRGNLIYRQDDGEVTSTEFPFADPGRIDFSKYPRKSSDIVALVVLEHQCRVHNLLTAASVRYRRAAWLARVIDPETDPDAGQAGRVADGMAEKIVGALLFRDEADLGEGVEGDRDFQNDYAARFPKAGNGRSLADFRLYRRMFKHRCSCMIYSAAFQALPERVRRAVLDRLARALETGEGPGDHLAAPERRKIMEILDDTLPGWK